MQLFKKDDYMNNIFELIPKQIFESYKVRVEEGIYRDISLVLGVIDSVFSIASKYESTINVVNRFVEYVNIDRTKDEYTTSDFIKQFGTYAGDKLANDIFKNRQRTSTRNGILKAEAVKQIIEIFNNNGIETKGDLLNCEDIDQIEKQVKEVKGQGSGITFEYIMMHAGDENRFKPDRHVYTFFEELLMYGPLSEVELEKTFYKELEIVKMKYPFFTARTLDSLIWEFIKYHY